MKFSTLLRSTLLLSVAAFPLVALAADPPAKVTPEFRVPRVYVATGSSSEADLARLRAAIGKLAGVLKVETRPEEDGATVTIDGDGGSTQSLLAAAAKTAGYRLRPAPTRFYLATGSNSDEDLKRLQETLQQTPGVDQVALSKRTEGAALRVGGAARNPTLVAAGKAAGFTLEALTSYVASGPYDEADLSRLRTALRKLPGVERVEMQGLIGGATLLIHGDTNDDRMAAAGKTAGFIVWPLASADGRREFLFAGQASPTDHGKLIEALRGVEGIGEFEIRPGPDGNRLLVTGGQARPPAIVGAATGAGFRLVPDETVVLPTLTPEAERNTPPDYDNRVLTDQAQPGGPAPAFSLLAKDGKTTISLSDYVGKRPVVLLFGSCT